MRTIFKSSGILQQALTRLKTKLPILKKVVVYKIPCQDCETSYVGETKRSLQKRVTEHKYVVKNNDRKNGIAVHAWDMGQRPNWEAAEILDVESQYVKRRVLEAVWIRNTKHVCNLDCGMGISEAWTALT